MEEKSYPYPSTLNISNFVTIKLSSSSNYSLWKAQIICLLESQELISFIDGTNLVQLDLKWKRSDRLVKGWILGSLDEEMLQYVVEKVSARDVWLKLEEICSHNSLKKFQETEESKKDYYLPLYKALLCGDWKIAQTFLKNGNEASRAHITSMLQTTLHIAIGSKKDDDAKFFIQNLVNSITDDDALAIKDSFGETPLHYAARFGNLDAAKILVNRNSNLPRIVSNNGVYPIHLAVEYGYKCVDLVQYLFSVTKCSAPYSGEAGARLLHLLICSDLYDFAIQLVKSSPDLAKCSSNGSSPLALLATKTCAFIGTNTLNSPKRLSYIVTRAISWIFQGRGKVCDIENAVDDNPKTNSSEMEQQNAIKLAECLCDKLQRLSDKEIDSIVGDPLLQAARSDNYKLVEIIVNKFPSSVYYRNKNGKNILHIAVENRCTNVFRLVSQMNLHRHHLVTSIDSSDNTVLHLAGKLSDENELNCTFGAALQMQEELRWFEAVKQMLPPSYYKRLNNKGKTAHQVFTEQHANLRIKGEKWMKDVAIPCTIIAALVLIVSFAASIIFPCIKNCEKALPISSKPDFFISLFIFSNIISLSTSFISLLAFVSILPCRDLQLVLPERLLCGCLTLYAALEALMLSFGCALYFVLKDNEMVFYFVFLVVVLPILAFQHWRGLFINHLFSLVKKKKTML